MSLYAFPAIQSSLYLPHTQALFSLSFTLTVAKEHFPLTEISNTTCSFEYFDPKQPTLKKSPTLRQTALCSGEFPRSAPVTARPLPFLSSQNTVFMELRKPSLSGTQVANKEAVGRQAKTPLGRGCPSAVCAPRRALLGQTSGPGIPGPHFKQQ